MSTTMTPNQPRRRPPQPQPRVSVRAREAGEARDNQYDLLTAALIGMTIGAGLTFLMRRGPSGRRPVAPMIEGIERGASWAGRGAAKIGKRGARWAKEQGEELWDRFPSEEIADRASEYARRAHDAIDDAVSSELRGLRRSLRRQRKRLGL